jgi:hypothetical protein
MHGTAAIPMPLPPPLILSKNLYANTLVRISAERSLMPVPTATISRKRSTHGC